MYSALQCTKSVWAVTRGITSARELSPGRGTEIRTRIAAVVRVLSINAADNYRFHFERLAMTTGHPIRVVIADDHSVVREGLKTIIKSEPEMKVVAECGTWPEAIMQIVRHRPDIAIVDLHMPGGEAPAGIATIRAQFIDAKIIVFAGFDADEEVYESIRGGARGYLLKSGSDREDLLRCIHAVLIGRVWIDPSAAGKLAERMNAPTLTKREIEIVQMMVTGKSNKEIGSSLNVTEGTIKVHLNHIFAKLGVTGRVTAVSAAVHHGFATLPPTTPLAVLTPNRKGRPKG